MKKKYFLLNTWLEKRHKFKKILHKQYILILSIKQ